MTSPGGRVRIDQVCYRWADYDLFGNRGFGPVESSLTVEQLRERNTPLNDRARVDDDAEVAGFRPSLCYVRSGGWAAVVWRGVEARPGGGPLGHALVGPRPVLTARHALALYDWPGWGRGGTAPLGLDQLVGSQAQAAAELTGKARLVGAPLAAVVAARLRHPKQRLGVVIPAERTVLATPAAFLWGVLEVVTVLWTGRNDGAEDPTFSTHERDLTGSGDNGLQVVLAPREMEPGSYRPTRAVTYPYRDAAGSDGAADRASAAVEQYLAGGPAQLRDWWERIQAVESERRSWQPGWQSGPLAVLRPAEPPATVERQSEATRLASTGAGNPPGSALASSLAAAPGPAGPSRSELVKLVGRLRRARSRQEAEHLLAVLADRSRDARRTDRARLREKLVEHGFCLAELGQHLRGEEYRAAVRRLVEAAAGEDLRNGGEAPYEWSFLARPETPELVVRTVGDLAADTGDGIALVALWRGMRMYGEHGSYLPEPSQPEARQLLRAVRRRRSQLSLVEISALVLILVAIGVLVTMLMAILR